MTSNRNTQAAGAAYPARPEPPDPAAQVPGPAADVSTVGPCPAVQADPVLAAAYDVLLDMGPRHATLTEIARRAGVSRMTVYRRYEHLDRLVSAVLTAEMRVVLTQALEGAVGDDERTRLAATVAGAARAIADHPLMVRLLQVDPQSLLPVMVTRRGSTQRMAEQLLEALLSASTDGSIRVVDPAVAARTIATTAAAFVFTSAIARAEGDSEIRWTELHQMIAGYLR